MIAAISNHYLFSFKKPHNASCEHMIWNRLVPAPLQSGCFWTQIPINRTTFEWSYCFKMRSCKNFFFCSSGSVWRKVLTAAKTPVSRNQARYTSTPKLPWYKEIIARPIIYHWKYKQNFHFQLFQLARRRHFLIPTSLSERDALR